MMADKIHLDLMYVKSAAAKNRAVYSQLKKNILRISSNEFDEIIHPLAKEITAKNRLYYLRKLLREFESAGEGR